MERIDLDICTQCQYISFNILNKILISVASRQSVGNGEQLEMMTYDSPLLQWTRLIHIIYEIFSPSYISRPFNLNTNYRYARTVLI